MNNCNNVNRQPKITRSSDLAAYRL